MRRKLALLTAGLIAGATLSLGTAAPAHAQICKFPDPVFVLVCRVYREVGDTAYQVYCEFLPPCR